MNKKLILLLLIFIIIQLPIVFYVTIPADENVLYATSRAISQGYTIYQDFFHGHSPFHPYLYSFLIDIFGVNLPILKLFTLMIYFCCGLFVYLICKEKYGEKAGLISFFLFMTCYDALFASFSFGIELSVLFFLMSLYYLNKNNYLSGLFFALSIMTRLHIIFLGLPLFLFSKERKKFLIGFSVCVVYYGLLIFLVDGFFTQVFLYHSIKARFFGGWVSYFRSSVHLWVLFFFSIKIKDIKLVFIGATYLLSLLLMKSTFEYYFLLVTVILCIEGSNALIHSRQKKLLWFMVFFFIFLLTFKAAPFLVNQTKGYNKFADYIDTLEDKPLVGQSAITSLLALKTNRDISLNQIDTNYQRRAIYDYSDAIVIYDRDIFTGQLFNCTLIRDFIVEKETYGVWDC